MKKNKCYILVLALMLIGIPNLFAWTTSLSYIKENGRSVGKLKYSQDAITFNLSDDDFISSTINIKVGGGASSGSNLDCEIRIKEQSKKIDKIFTKGTISNNSLSINLDYNNTKTLAGIFQGNSSVEIIIVCSGKSYRLGSYNCVDFLQNVDIKCKVGKHNFSSATNRCTVCNQLKSSMVLVPGDDFEFESFYIASAPVTQLEYFDITGKDPSDFSGCDNPVERVSWYDALEYCNKKSEREGLEKCYSKDSNGDWRCDFTKNGYRLPTEAEWQYAAGGGNKSRGYIYAGSSDIDEVAWYSKNSDKKTHAVGMKKANELGLYDMSGNVFEWGWDWVWDEQLGYRINCVNMGGSWNNSSVACKFFLGSHWDYAGVGYYDIGFRLARSI